MEEQHMQRPRGQRQKCFMEGASRMLATGTYQTLPDNLIYGGLQMSPQLYPQVSANSLQFIIIVVEGFRVVIFTECPLCAVTDTIIFYHFNMVCSFI